MSNLNTRETVWLTAWANVANANDCKSWESATSWADKCLKAFDERFPASKQFSPEEPASERKT